MYRLEELLDDCENPPVMRRGRSTKASESVSRLAAKHGGSSQLQLLDRQTYQSVWESMEDFLNDMLRVGKGVHLPRFGRFTFVKGQTRPLLLLSDEFTQPYSLRYRQPPVGHTVPDVDLNFAKIAHQCKLTKDVVKGAYRDFIARLGEALGEGDKTVEVDFVGLGTLEGDRFNLKFVYEGDAKQRAATTAAFTNAPLESGLDLKVGLRTRREFSGRGRGATEGASPQNVDVQGTARCSAILRCIVVTDWIGSKN